MSAPSPALGETPASAPAPEAQPVQSPRVAAPSAHAAAESRGATELLHLAELARRAGDRNAEYAYLAEIVERDSSHPRAHARLAEITGPAPPTRSAGSEDLVSRALRHPYDPSALVAAAEVLAARGRKEGAIEFLERCVWLADLDPAAALTAIRRLYELSDDWRPRRIVPVQLHVDESIRAQPGWEFQMRALWLSLSSMLDPLLNTRFVPIAIQPFDTAGLPNDLDAIHAAFLERARAPAQGVFALITGRALPSGEGVYRKGVAEILGRNLAARVAPGAVESRVLAHEILHLYGALHVLDGVDTLMNPTGESLAIDAPNARLVRLMRGREFGSGGIDENVLPWIDLGAAVAAYRSALSVNLALRDAGIQEAIDARDGDPEQLALRIQSATQLDWHLADAARIVAALMLADGQRVEALRLLDLSSQLYGPSTPRGLASAEKARVLRESLGAANAAEPGAGPGAADIPDAAGGP